jgi:hypothetical protein
MKTKLLILQLLLFSTTIFSGQTPCGSLGKERLDSITGYFDDDQVLDYLQYGRDPNDRENIIIIVCTQKSFYTYNYSLSESHINIRNSEPGTIEIAEGSFSGSAPITYYYYSFNPTFASWFLTKTLSYEKCISGDGILSPKFEISYAKGNTRIDGQTIPAEKAFTETESNRISKFNQLFSSEYERLLIGFKKNQLSITKGIDICQIAEMVHCVPISKDNLGKYNDFAFFLSQTKEGAIGAVYILETLINKFPERIVAYLNIADVYFDLKTMPTANKYYLQYVNLMKKDGKEGKIPKRVSEFLTQNKK